MLLGVVETVADDEFVGNLKADVVCWDVVLAPGFFGEQNTGANFPGLHGLQFADHRAEGFAGVEDVIDEQYIAVADVEPEFLGEHQLGGLGAVAITGDADEVEPHWQIDFTDEIGQEHEGAGEQPDDDEVAVPEIPLNLLRQSGDAFPDFLFGNQLAGDGIAWIQRVSGLNVARVVLVLLGVAAFLSLEVDLVFLHVGFEDIVGTHAKRLREADEEVEQVDHLDAGILFVELLIFGPPFPRHTVGEFSQFL